MSYEKIEAKDMASMSLVSEKEIAEFEENQIKINSDPLVRVEIQRRMNEYYLKSWVR